MPRLNIPPASGQRHDFLALGALVARLDPGIVPFCAANHYDLYVSGGEYNVAANLARCFGLRSAIASAVVDYPIGQRVRAAVRENGVESYYKEFSHDGVRGPNIAQVWSDRGQGLRAPTVFYNRANEAAAQLRPGDFDWQAIFASGVRWFHSGGIFASLSESTADLILEAMRAARKAGAVVSFDLNYRAKLWNSIPGGARRAREVLTSIVQEVDVLVGNEEDMQLGLGIAGPEAEARSGLDPSAFLAAIEKLASRFQRLCAIATTLRDVRSTNTHGWSAVLWCEGKSYVAPTRVLEVYDRVGGGDGFAAGLIYGLLSGEQEEKALSLGWAHGALLTSFPGDTSLATLEQVRALASGGSARIQR